MKNSACLLRVIVCTTSWLLGVALHAQVTPAPGAIPGPILVPAANAAPDSETPTQYGLRFADFVTVNEAMMQTALEDPAIIALSEQIEVLVAQREALVIEKTIQKNPALTDKLQTMKATVTELKRKREEQKAQVRAIRSGDPVAPPKG